MKKINKKGFTIVELVIVIAVIAILSAVLIPTFSTLIHKAKVSSDTQLVKNLNTALTVDSIENGKHNTMAEALAAAEKSGYIIDKINASATNNEILWDSKNDVFVYLTEEGINYIPDSTPEDANPADYWVISNVVNQTYSTYLLGVAENTTVEAINNLDGTALYNINVVYNGNENVAIYTNGGSLTVNSGSVTHYGVAYLLTVSDSANFTENGTHAANSEDIVEVSNEYTLVNSLEELKNAINNKVSKIALNKNINIDVTDLTWDIVVPSDYEGEINLNGYNISSVHTAPTSSSSVNNGIFRINGKLDITGEGIIAFEQKGNNMGWSNLSAVFSVEAGELSLSSGVKVENKGGTDMAYAVDVNTSNGESVLNVNGAFLKSTYTAVRIFNNHTTQKGIINLNKGIIEGLNRDIWNQLAGSTSKAENGVVNINSSYTYTIDGTKYYID